MEKKHTLAEILETINKFADTRNTYSYHKCCNSLTTRNHSAYKTHTDKLAWGAFARDCRKEEKSMKEFLIEKLALNDENSSVFLNKSCSAPKEGTYDHEEREKNQNEKLESQRSVLGLGKRNSVQFTDNDNDDTINEGIHHYN